VIDDDCGATGGVNRITRRKPAPVPLCSQQVPNDLPGVQIRAAAVRSLRLTTSATARHIYIYIYIYIPRYIVPGYIVFPGSSLNICGPTVRLSLSYRIYRFPHIHRSFSGQLTKTMNRGVTVLSMRVCFAATGYSSETYRNPECRHSYHQVKWGK
jgi:hypothetical protein